MVNKTQCKHKLYIVTMLLILGPNRIGADRTGAMLFDKTLEFSLSLCINHNKTNLMKYVRLQGTTSSLLYVNQTTCKKIAHVHLWMKNKNSENYHIGKTSQYSHALEQL